MDKYFLKCDISGIQPFIFNVPSKRAAKNLRKRSLYVKEFSDHCFGVFNQRIGVKQEDVVYHGAGNFYIYLNSDAETLDAIIKEIQDEVITSDLFPYIAYIKCIDEDFAAHMRFVNAELQKVQLKRPVSSAFFSSEYRELATTAEDTVSANSLQPRNEKGDLYTFEEIARFSTGVKKIAALKLDVDNLGTLFLYRKKDQYKKLSQSLTVFFEKELSRIIRGNNMEKYVYAVFSGGDDCFLIGSWDKILFLAIEIRTQFAIYIQKKKSEGVDFPNELTFSAGIIIVTPSYPMVRLAEEVEEALSQSKNRPDKNSVTCFGKSISWTDFEKAKVVSGQLTDLIKRGASKSILGLIRSDVVNPALKESYSREKEIPKVWHLKYYLRNMQGGNMRGIEEDLERILDDYTRLLLKFYVKKGVDVDPVIYPIAARWAELCLNKN